jgi:hypothetical protein
MQPQRMTHDLRIQNPQTTKMQQLLHTRPRDKALFGLDISDAAPQEPFPDSIHGFEQPGWKDKADGRVNWNH